MSNVDRGYEWRKVRSKVIKRDNGKCVACGMSRSEHKERYNQDLEVHHKTPAHVFEDEDGETYERFAHHPKNLVTLCSGCHKRATSDGGRYALGYMPKPEVKRRYSRLKPFEMTDTEFIEDLLDAYELVRSGEQTVIEPNITAEVEVSADELADKIAEKMASKYTGVDEAELASKIAYDVESRMRDW